MKNILLLTNIYPMNDPAYDGTPVCHFFTREWVKMGYNVRVVHFMSLFPEPYYWVGRLFGEQIAAKTGCVTYSHPSRKYEKYKVDEVPVLYVPITKFIPHHNFSRKRIENAFQWVCRQLKQEGFVPDVVTAHFPLPQLEMLYLFKQKYASCRTCLVLHGDGSQIPEIYPDMYQDFMNAVDVWGFRSLAFKNQFNEIFGEKKNEFLCYSGIPDAYFPDEKRKFEGPVRNFVFVGSLFKLKNVDVTIKALHQAFPEGNFHLDIVGSGAENENLRHLVETLDLTKNVVFWGQQQRDEAQKVMATADCFVMVSTREAFGLVYVEAMAKGCVTVATKGQGIDGVIVDGENGFLCEAENVDALAAVLRQISQLPIEKLNDMADQSVHTARQLTNKKVAESYINAIIQSL